MCIFICALMSFMLSVCVRCNKHDAMAPLLSNKLYKCICVCEEMLCLNLEFVVYIIFFLDLIVFFFFSLLTH